MTTRTATPIPPFELESNQGIYILMTWDRVWKLANTLNKTSTPKYPRLSRKRRFIWEKDVVRCVPIQNRGMHPVNKKACYGDDID